MRVTCSPINITESSGHDLPRYISFYLLVICEFELHICFFFHLCLCFLYFVLDFKFWDCLLVRCISHLIDWWACYLHAYVWLNLWMLYVLVCIAVLCIVWSIPIRQAVYVGFVYLLWGCWLWHMLVHLILCSHSYAWCKGSISQTFIHATYCGIGKLRYISCIYHHSGISALTVEVTHIDGQCNLMFLCIRAFDYLYLLIF